MGKNLPIHERICQAMTDAGVRDADSPEGINFCVEQCPYAYCVVFENKMSPQGQVILKKTAFARSLLAHGVTQDDAALILHIKRSTLLRYLKK